MKLTRLIIAFLVALLCGAVHAQAPKVEDLLQDSVPIYQGTYGGLSESLIPYVPLPSGDWLITYTGTRTSTGLGTQNEILRDVRLRKIVGGKQVQAIEITAQMAALGYQKWVMEPCKKTVFLYKEKHPRREECLSIVPGTFLQGNNESTRAAIAILKKKGATFDSNSLAVSYTRYDEYRYLSVILHIFPSVYGLDNRFHSNLNASPWHPSKIDENIANKKFVGELIEYSKYLAVEFNKAFEKGGTVTPLKDFSYSGQDIGGIKAVPLVQQNTPSAVPSAVPVVVPASRPVPAVSYTSSRSTIAVARKAEEDKKVEEQQLAEERKRLEEDRKQLAEERKRLEEDRRRMEVERIAREGDGSEDDIYCQKRKLTPSTPQYLNCRTSLVDKREKDEAARIASVEKKRMVDEARDAVRIAAERAAEEKKRKQEEARVANITKPIQNDFTGDGRLSLDASRVKCAELGFKPATEGFGKCVLQLSK